MAVGTTVRVVAKPVNLLKPIPYIGLSFATIRLVARSITYGSTLLPIVGLECFISLSPSSAMLVVVLIISEGKDIKFPTGSNLAVLTMSPT